jgi:predicted dehydrogenase
MQPKIRYAVVGQGYFAQKKVLPAFAHAKKNSVLTALFSDDPVKQEKLGGRYDAEHALGYDQYDDFLKSGAVDAVYLALPNHLHCTFTERAAAAGVHVLVEKPMALDTAECTRMIRACERSRVKLMVAYRLHFEEANMKAVELVASGKLGEPRFFRSSFAYQVRPENIRTQAEKGGGPLYDLGVYCINAARYLFRAEPLEVAAFTAQRPEDTRFRDIEESLSAMMVFPDDRLASFTVSFGTQAADDWELVGTQGKLRLAPAFDYDIPLEWTLSAGDNERHHKFRLKDQVAPELLHFSECILSGRDPEPSGREGLADVRIIEALQRSAAVGRAVKLPDFHRRERPGVAQVETKPDVGKPKLIHAEEPVLD